MTSPDPLRHAALEAAKALEVAQRWLANSVPVVELDGPKPLPIIAAARAALLAELAREPWTREAPAVSGWYWYRGEPDLNAKIVWVSSQARSLEVFSFASNPVELLGGEWSGPILCPAAPVSEGGAK